MGEQFIPFELAVKLKELGFDKECMSFYNQSGKLNLSRIDSFDWVIMNSKMLEQKLDYVSAPLWQQASDWFRDKGYHSFTELQDNTREYYWYNTIQDSNDREFNDQTMVDSSKNIWLKEKFDTFEEARLRRLEELIKIVEKNKS